MEENNFILPRFFLLLCHVCKLIAEKVVQAYDINIAQSQVLESRFLELGKGFRAAFPGIFFAMSVSRTKRGKKGKKVVRAQEIERENAVGYAWLNGG